jgi:hypothetical protein
MTKCHIAYWELYPTLDHVVPLARGGSNDDENVVITSMLRNQIKANWTLEEVGWQMYPAGDLREWDGLLGWFVEYGERQPAVRVECEYLQRWWPTTLWARAELANGAGDQTRGASD